MCPDDDAVFLHELDGCIRNLLAARDHPGHDTNAFREDDGIFRRHLPELAREFLVVERQHKRQRDEVRRMCMVDDAVLAVRHLFLELVRCEVRRQLARRAAAVDEPPDNTIILALLINLDQRDILLWCQRDIAHVLAAARYEEVLACKARHCVADWMPFLDLMQRILNRFDLFWFDAVRQIAAIALMPPLLESISRQALKSFHEC